MICYQSTFREIIQSLYQERLKKNPSYSMRAFAKKLGTSHSTLLEVISGKKSVSSERAWEMGKRLGLSDLETEYLFLIVEKEKLEESPLTEKINLRLETLRMIARQHTIEIGASTGATDWEHMAVLTLMDQNPDLIEKLGLSENRLKQVLADLTSAGLIHQKEDGEHEATNSRFLFSADTPSLVLKKFHQQMLTKTTQTIESNAVEKRFMGSEFFVMDQETLAEAKKLADNFLNELSALAKKSQKKDALYHAGVQLIPLSE